MKFIRFTLFLVLFLTGIPLLPSALAANETGPDKSFYIVQDCQTDWLVYSKRFGNYIPFTRSSDESELSVSLFVDLLKNRNYTLLIHTQKENYLFIEGALQKKILPDQWLTLSIDSLYRTTRKEELLLTLFGSPGISGKEVYVANPKTKGLTNVEEASPSIINIKPKPTSHFGDFSILALILILALNLLTFYTSPYLYSRFINPLEFFDRSSRNEMYKLNKPFSQEVIFFVTLASSVTSYLLLVVTHSGFDMLPTDLFLSEGATFFQYMTDYAKLFLLSFILFYGKYILMSLVGGVLNLNSVINLHFLKVLQATYLFYAVVVLLRFSYSTYQPFWLPSSKEILLLVTGTFYLIRFVSLYMLINSKGPFINLYLFSYLCVIEIFPLIIVMKFVI